jgi:diacylglycerol kinase family enzyme
MMADVIDSFIIKLDTEGRSLSGKRRFAFGIIQNNNNNNNNNINNNNNNNDKYIKILEFKKF